MSITTASSFRRAPRSTASWPFRARAATAKRPFATRTASSESRNASSSSATRIRYLPLPTKDGPGYPGSGPAAAAVRPGPDHVLRDLDVEGGAGAAVGLDPDPPVDTPHELAADVEAEPGAADPTRHVRVEAVELLEDAPLLGRRDAEPGVSDRETDVPVVRRDRDVDDAARRRVLDRVVDQVREHLAQLAGVCGDGRQHVRGIQEELDVLG